MVPLTHWAGVTRRPGATLLVAVLMVAFALAGCLGSSGGLGPLGDDGTGPSGADGDDTAGNGTPTDDGSGTDDDGDQTDGGDDTGDGGNQTDDGNGTGDGDDGDDTDADGNATDPEPPTWPPLDQARIRPGVEMTMGNAQCTAAFVLSSPDNATLYVATASHCVGGLSLGDPVAIGGVNGAGTVAYCSWLYTEGADDDDVCPDSDDGFVLNSNDLALIEVRPQHRGTVHPAMLVFGGPTGLASSASTGTHVLTYGDSGLRPGDAADPREGYVLSSSTWTTTTYFAPPSLPGDSGSPAVTASGSAVGVLSGLAVVPPGANTFVNLDAALAFAEDRAGLQVELKTWELLEDGLLP